MPVLIAVFVLYFVAVTWQMRRALAAKESARTREASRLLLLVSLGIPLTGALILVAW